MLEIGFNLDFNAVQLLDNLSLNIIVYGRSFIFFSPNKNGSKNISKEMHKII